MGKRTPLVVSGIVCLALTLVMLSFTPSAVSAKVYKWRLQAFMGPGTATYEEALPRFIENVKKMSKGQIDITLYAPGALVPPFQLFKNIGRGVVTMGQDAGVYWMGFMPIGELVWGWPFTFQHAQEIDYFYWGLGAMDIVRKACAEHGVYILVNAAQNRYGSVNSTVPIKGLKDFKGLKIRTFSTFAKIMQRYGSSTMTFPGSEIYTALATKVIDGATWGSPADTNALKLHEVAKYYNMPAWQAQSPLTLEINLKTWQALPEDLKAILQTAALAYAADVSMRSWYKDAVVLDDWQKNHGVTVNWFSQEDMNTARKIAYELLDEKAKQDAYSAEFIALMKKHLKLLGYMD
jgi:TRAP-type mannitol/chloroaromatic compound transport system substrate-binding protein